MSTYNNGYVRQKNNHPISFDKQGNLTDQITGEKGTMILPEITVTKINPKNPLYNHSKYIALYTYYPIISRYPYTGHSQLIMTAIDKDRYRSYDINKTPKHKDYNLITNNCSDATRDALEKTFNKKSNSLLFTTPGDVQDFALKQLNGIPEIKGDSIYDRTSHKYILNKQNNKKQYSRRKVVYIPINDNQKNFLKQYIEQGHKNHLFKKGGNIILKGQQGLVTQSDNTRVAKPIIQEKVRYKLKPNEFYFVDKKTGKRIIGRQKQEVISSDNRTINQRKQDQSIAKQIQKKQEANKNYEKGLETISTLSTLAMPSTYIGPAFNNNGKSYLDNVISGEGTGNTTGNLAIDLAIPFGLKSLGFVNNLKNPRFLYNQEIRSPYYKYDINGKAINFDIENVAQAIRNGKQDFIDDILSPEYAEAAKRNIAEAQKLGLEYTPVFNTKGFKSLIQDGITPKFINSKESWHGRTSFMGGTPGKVSEIEYNVRIPTNIRNTTAHEVGHIARWGNGETIPEYQYMKYKSSQLFNNNGDVGVYEFGTQTGEGATNMRDLGKDMGITQKTPYPGYEQALQKLQYAQKNSSKGGIVNILKLDKEHMPYIWRALQGLHYGIIPIGITTYGFKNK